MRHDKLHEVLQSVYKSALEEIKKKNAAYSDNNDGLANFKEAARFQGMSEYQIWGTYFYKHVSSIFKAIKDNPDMPEDKSEGFRSRIIDAICYLGILYAIDVEKELGEVLETDEEFEKRKSMKK